MAGCLGRRLATMTVVSMVAAVTLLGAAMAREDVTMADLSTAEWSDALVADTMYPREGRAFGGAMVFDIGESDDQEPEEGAENEVVTGGQKVTASTFSSQITAGNQEKVFYQVQGPASDQRRQESSLLGELMHDRTRSAENEAVTILQQLDKDDSNAELFDLVPIWKGMVADEVRSAAMVKNCVQSMDLWITRSICKEWGPAVVEDKNSTNSSSGNSSNVLRTSVRLGESLQQEPVKPEDVCRKYSLEPMSDAMNELWQNVQKNFLCSKKEKHCDATLCYKTPGPMDSDNEPTAEFHTFEKVPLTVLHNNTDGGDMLVQQMVDLDLKMEKITLCEKLKPELAVPGKPEMSQPGLCHTAKRCRIVNTPRFGDCYDGTAEQKSGIPCPDDAAFKQALVDRQMSLVMSMCNNI